MHSLDNCTIATDALIKIDSILNIREATPAVLKIFNNTSLVGTCIKDYLLTTVPAVGKSSISIKDGKIEKTIQTCVHQLGDGYVWFIEDMHALEIEVKSVMCTIGQLRLNKKGAVIN